MSKAERLLAEILAGVESKFGSVHPLRGEALAAMAEVYLDMGRFPEAQTACREAIDILEKSVGPDSDITAMARNDLARMQIIQGNYKAGYELACSALSTVETVLVPAHPDITMVNETVTLAQEMESVTRLAAIIPQWIALPLNIE